MHARCSPLWAAAVTTAFCREFVLRCMLHPHSSEFVLHCVCVSSKRVLYLIILFHQSGVYNPWAEDEPAQAARLQLPFDIRGHESMDTLNGQRRRPDGALALHACRCFHQVSIVR